MGKQYWQQYVNNQNNSLLHDNNMFSLAARDPKQRFALFRIRALALCMACVVGHIVGHIGKSESLEKLNHWKSEPLKSESLEK